MSDFSFVPLRPFFCAALAKRWKVQYRQGFAYFNNNVDSKRHINIRTAILYIYICIHICICIYKYGEQNIVLVLVPCVDSDK